jgi:hypothetical protein
MYSIQLFLSHLTQAENQMKSGLFLDIVVSQRATILQLLAGKDEPLLVGRAGPP